MISRLDTSHESMELVALLWTGNFGDRGQGRVHGTGFTAGRDCDRQGLLVAYRKGRV